MTDNEILLTALNEGIIDLGAVRQIVEMNKRQELLQLHKYKIWQGSNGKWYTELHDPETKKRKLVKKSTYEAVEDAIIEHYKPKEPENTFKTVFDEWVETKLKRKDIGQGTYDRYNGEYVRFIQGTELDEISIHNIDEEILEDFIKRRIVDLKLTAKAYANMKTIIIGTFKYAKKKGLTSISISTFFDDMEVSRKIFAKPEKKKQVFTNSEREKLIKYFNANPNIYNMGLLLTFQTGMREGELAALKFTDLTGQEIHVQRQEIRYKGKNKKMVHEIVEYTKTDAGDRHIILTESAQETVAKIRQINPDGEYMMMNGSRRLHKQLFDDWIYKACDNVGIERCSMHKIRKTYGTTLLNAGVDKSLVTDQMGHSDIATTLKSYYYDNNEADEKLQQIQKAIAY